MRVFRIPAWLLLAALTILTIVPASDRPETGVNHELEHILSFGLLGVLFSLGYIERQFRIVIGGALFTLALELSQIPLPTRHARLEDFVFDTVAVWAGSATVYLLRKLSRSVPRGLS